MGKDFLTWDEFNPALYKLTATLNSGKQSEKKQVQFGMRDFKIEGKWFYVNGRKTMLRGTVENCDFPAYRLCTDGRSFLGTGLPHLPQLRIKPYAFPLFLSTGSSLHRCRSRWFLSATRRSPAGLITVRDWATGSRLTNI